MDKSIVPVNHQIAARSSTCYEFSNPNEAEVVEIEDDPVENVEKLMNDLEIGHQFNEKDVPQIFQTFINNRMNGLKNVCLHLGVSLCVLKFDGSRIRFEKKNADWTITYNDIDTTIETADPEKSIMDHLWFVLKNPNIKLDRLLIFVREISKVENRDSDKLDSNKLDTLLLSMIDSINHQFHIGIFGWVGFNEDTFLSILKHVKPGILHTIGFLITWKMESTLKERKEKVDEIMKTNQWEQGWRTWSTGAFSLDYDLRDFDWLLYESNWMEL